jgi:Tfp pilus assembly protein PilF
MIYELVGLANSNEPELEVRPDDRRLSEMTWLASKCFEAGDLKGAEHRYRDILEQFPDDGVAKSILAILAAGFAEQRAGR